MFHFDASEARDTSQSPFGNSSIYRETNIFVWKEKYLFKLSGCFEMKHWESAEHSCGAAKKTIKHAVIKFAFAIFSLPRCFFEREFFRPSFNQTRKRKSTLK